MQPLIGASWYLRVMFGPIFIAAIPLSDCGGFGTLPPTMGGECLQCYEQYAWWSAFCFEQADGAGVIGECTELLDIDCPISTYTCEHWGIFDYPDGVTTSIVSP